MGTKIEVEEVLAGILRHAVPFGSVIADAVLAVVNSYQKELREGAPFDGQDDESSVDERIASKMKDKFG